MQNTAPLTVVGAACWYAGALDLISFWQAILTRRAGFRRMREERLSLGDYGPAAGDAGDEVDRTYVTKAALIDGFQFDWRKRRIPRGTYLTTDLTHWLALEVATSAIAHAGIDLRTLDRQRVAVIVGNSLTGEISRANLLRLRWPYVRHALARACAETGVPDADRRDLLRATERAFKDPLPEPNEDTLAGSLSNVIAGRIANHLDIYGGAYAVDGACASSLLAITTGCDGILAGRWDIVIAGGVDISLDPLELVGFARVGALSRGAMRVYDERSAGFLPGEGAGFVVLESAASAARAGRVALAHINGWGISSDGAGGITAPSPAGQAAALRRAYEQAGYPLNTVDFIEGHGTGTPLGDKVELTAMTEVAGPRPAAELRSIGVTSAKTLFGHTKAAAGAAGFIKAMLAVNQRVLPPLPGADRPHAVLRQPDSRLYPLAEGDVRDRDSVLRAGVSSAGFGGINCHIALSSPDAPPIDLGGVSAETLLASSQSVELAIAAGASSAALERAIAALLRDCEGISDGELSDLCVHAGRNAGAGPWRMAAVAADPLDLVKKLTQAQAALKSITGGVRELLGGELLIGHAAAAPRVGFLFPGQGAQFLRMGARLTARFGWAAERLDRWDEAFAATGEDGLRDRILRPLHRAPDAAAIERWKLQLRDTRWAQPAVALTALNWAEWLALLGISPSVVAGHSLGELPALLQAGATAESELIDILKVRARAAGSGEAGVMASLSCSAEQARDLAARAPGYCVLANHNASDRSVVAGEAAAVAAVEQEAAGLGIDAIRLEVSNAFHSRYMQAAGGALAALGDRVRGRRELRIPFASAMTGQLMRDDIDVVDYASAQVVAPVRYVEAIERMAGLCDVVLELGPGQIQTGLVHRIRGGALPIWALEPNADSADHAMCLTVGQLFVRGCPVRPDMLYEGRFVRPFVPARERIFIANPCEPPAGVQRMDPVGEHPWAESPALAGESPQHAPATAAPVREAAGTDAFAALRRIIADLTGYDEDTIETGNRLASDLRLDSIKIAEVGGKLTRLGWTGVQPVQLQTGTVGDIVAAMRLERPAGSVAPNRTAAGVPQAALVLRDLPVHFFTLAWSDAPTLAFDMPARPAALFFDARDGDSAMRLWATLAASGQSCTLVPWQPGNGVAAMGAPATQVIALLPRIAVGAPLRDSELSNRLGSYLASLAGMFSQGVDELMLISFDASSEFLAIDGLGLGATALLEGLARRVRVLRLSEIPADFRAGTAGVSPALSGKHEAAGGTPAVPGPALPGTLPTARQPLEYLRLGPGGGLQRATLAPVLDRPAAPIALDDGDLVLVSGGLRGITAECAIALAQGRRLRFIVVGRTAADALDAEAAANLRRLTEASEAVAYVGCDIADPAAVHAAVAPKIATLGPPRGIVHGAGINLPAAMTRFDAGKAAREIATKAAGLAALIALADPAALRLCVGLGSVIATTGMFGNAGYALANEMMAAQLRALKTTHPHIRVACPGFSVWREVGMGAKLASTAVVEELAGSGIDPRAGVAAFLRCIGGEDGPDPLIVAAPMTGLPTWRYLQADTTPDAGRFLSPVMAHEPELLLVTRPVLSSGTDRYLEHHRFNGTTLFPTVFALEAFVSAAIALRAVDAGSPVAIEGLMLRRPIVVNDDAPRAIELDARRRPDRVGQVEVAIGDPGIGAIAPIFTGIVSAAADPGQLAVVVSGQVPARDLSDHLYDGLLFQGPPFRRIEQVERLDLSDPVQRAGCFRIRRDPDPSFAAVDPYFLDALLQTVQVLVPQDVCLPRAIGRVTIGPGLRHAGPALVEARIMQRTDDGYICRVVAIDPDDGTLVASLEDYDVGIVEHVAERPSLEALLDPMRHDRQRIDAAMRRLCELGLAAACQLAAAPIRGSDPQAMRRQLAADLVAALPDAPTLNWDGDGRPMLGGTADRGVSISHAGGRLIAIVGPRGLACDLEPVRRRARHEWAAIVPAAFNEVVSDLSARVGGHDHAATMAWTAHECMIKAGIDVIRSRIVDAGPAGAVLDIEGAERRYRVFMTVLELALAGTCVLAVLEPGVGVAACTTPTFRHRFRPTFRDITTPLRTVAANTFFNWIGEARELAMTPIHAPLAEAFAPAAGNAMVTNFTEVELLAPVGFGQDLEVTVWLACVLEEPPSTFELGFVWRDAAGTPMARGRQRLTWVRLNDANVLRPAPFPIFFRDFLDARQLRPDEIGGIVGLDALAAGFSDTRRWRRSAGDAEPPPSTSLVLDTDLSHSNFVENIYFSHYGTMFERAVLKLAGSLPASRGLPALTVSSLRIDHLGEARPGDRLLARVELEEIGNHSLLATGQFINQSHGAVPIAIGRARLRPLIAADGGGPQWGERLPAHEPASKREKVLAASMDTHDGGGLRPGGRSRVVRILAALGLSAVAAALAPARATPASDEIAQAVAAGGNPNQLAARLDEAALDDVLLFNGVRLTLKARDRAADAQKFLAAVAERRRSPAVLYNLSLSYVDQLSGNNLLRKGFLSTASVRLADEILKAAPNDWMAWHIRGLNNLYWPDWFNRSPQAEIDLGKAVEVGQTLLRAHPDQDGLATTYLALGDAHALSDRRAEARSAWQAGARLYPYFTPLRERLALTDAALHATVRGERDSDKPIDTDLADLRTILGEHHALTLVGGLLFGPGPLPDQNLHPGGLVDLRLARPLTGYIPQMNNGTAEPHPPGEIAVGKALNGLFSDGTPVNKNVDVGHVFLLNGRFKLFLAALAGGPNQGVVQFYLDRYWNWTIQDDIGIDPGFPAGVIKFDNFTFSTSPRLLPKSTQSQRSDPGGVDRAGSLSSGEFVVGLLGDDDGDGKLDGTFNAIGSFPLDSVFLPGAPFAQTRVFQTDIAVSPELAGFLTLANAISYLRAAEVSNPEAFPRDEDELQRGFRDRQAQAVRHFAKAANWRTMLDEDQKAAFERLVQPVADVAASPARARFVCDADRDLAVLASALSLVRSDRDGSRLADLVRCGTP